MIKGEEKKRSSEKMGNGEKVKQTKECLKIDIKEHKKKIIEEKRIIIIIKGYFS